MTWAIRSRALKSRLAFVTTLRPGGSKTWTCDRVDLTDTVPRERRAFDGIQRAARGYTLHPHRP